MFNTTLDDALELQMSLADAANSCREAVVQVGWRILDQSETHIRCQEAASRLFSNSAQVEMVLSVIGASRTAVHLHGSIFGFGPIQKSHLQQQMVNLRNRVASATRVPAEPAGGSANARQVWINGAPPHPQGLTQLEQLLGLPLAPGRYWYDAACGAWGMWGGPVQGFIPPSLDLAVPLPFDASGGGTGVVINGRELHPQDVVMLNQLLLPFGAQCIPGRWFLDAAGNLGPEGGMPITNLITLQARGGQKASGNSWSSLTGSGNWDASGAGFVQTADGNFVSHGMG